MMKTTRMEAFIAGCADHDTAIVSREPRMPGFRWSPSLIGRAILSSDGVLAIILTIMVLEMKVPRGADAVALKPLAPIFGSYVMSFIYIGIYWNNHHHLIHATETIRSATLWANLHLLFWLSLIPFVTGWMGANDFAPLPTAFYGVVLLLAGIAWIILQSTLVCHGADNQRLKEALGRDRKAKLSIALYVLGMALALWMPLLAIAAYTLVAVIWFVPDRRFERAIRSRTSSPIDG